MNRPRKPSKKSSNRNKQILNYYYKFAQNRDLEKYLRLKSSSDERTFSASTPESVTKNLTHSPEIQCQRSKEDCAENHFLTPTNSASNPQENQTSYSLSCETNIAMTFPITDISPPKLTERTEEAAQTDDFKEKEKWQEIASGLPDETPKKTDQINHKKSPESVLKSGSKKLEWDSLGDVGYDKNDSNISKSASLSTLERSVLRGFFADKGIEINFPNNKKIQDDRLPKISEENKILTPRSSSFGAIPKISTKEKWRETLENVKQKYNSSPALASGSFLDKDISELKNMSAKRHSTPKTLNLEKFCQTSLIRKESQEIQCDFSNAGSIRSAFEVGSMTSQSSFEYIPQTLESEASSSNKENTMPQKIPNETINQKLRKSVTKLFELQKCSFSNESSYKEIELGIQLLCSLIDSKNMNDQQKKFLAKKIVSKITKSTAHNSNKSSSANSTTAASTPGTTAASSISSSVSRHSLIVSDNSVNKKITPPKHMMSGVSSLISSNASNNKISHCSSAALKEATSISSSSNRKKIDLNTKTDIDGKSMPKIPSNFSSIKQKNSKSDDQLCKSVLDKSSQVNVNSLLKSVKSLEIIEKIPIISTNEQSELSANETTATKSETSEDQETMREWLDPLTRSEIKYDSKLKNRNYEKNNIDIGGSGDFVPTTKLSKNVFETIENEKKTHLNWIDTEIKRLENLKNLLLTENKYKNSSDNKNYISDKPMEINVYSLKSNNMPDKILDTRNENDASSKTESESTKSNSSNVEESSKLTTSKSSKQSNKNYSSKTSEDYDKIEENANIIYDEVERHRSKEKIVKNEKKSKHENGNLKKHRSKLETPKIPIEQRTESVRSFAQQKKREFIEIYKRAHARDYDCPAETDHYSEPRNDNQKKTFSKNQYNSATTSSQLFISSESISIPISSGDSSSITTTHQYDSHCGIGVQTNESVLKTSPFFGTINKIQCNCQNPFKCNCDGKQIQQKTQRVYSMGRNQQVQVKPSAVSYMIEFENNKKETYENLNNVNQSEKVIKMGVKSVSDGVSLKEHFQKQCPVFYTKAEERQKVLRKMQRARQEREKKIRDIVENTSIRSIPRKLDLLPPPATKSTRIFSTKEMKSLTRKKQSKLPEVVEKLEKEKMVRAKKGNKILRDVFNKRLQNHVHKGKLTLEHSRTVI